MFAINPSLKKVDARPSEIITLLVSTNRPVVALSGPQQQADAFIISVARGKTQPVYLCFHVIKEGERLIYTSNTVPTSESARIKLEEEALRFAEDMGFMMVREQFGELASRQRDDAIMELAPFVDNISPIRQDEKTDKTQKADLAKKRAERELEYEEVYEEVEEEVPVEEEAPIEEEAAEPEEYESLSDVVSEVSSQEAAVPVVGGGGGTRQQEAPAAAAEAAVAGQAAETEEAFDLGEELSDVVETIREMPKKTRPAPRPVIDRPKPPQPAIERTARPETAAGASTGVVSDGRQAIIKLLISL